MPVAGNGINVMESENASSGIIASPQRIVVGLSGGVDSAVTAALLQERGLAVIGVTLRLQPCGGTAVDRRSCCGVDGVAQARAVAGQLGIPHYVVDCHEPFTQTVLRPCWEDYAAGRTPNPCVLCNRHIKFGFLHQFALGLGAHKVATGHYAQLLPDAAGHLRLHRGADRNKDQSYFLAGLTPAQLQAAEMPLGSLTKDKVRRLALARGLVNAARRESQDVCFAVNDGGFPEYLRQLFHADSRPGQIVDAAGHGLGHHDGIHRFTLGQRKGIGIALGQPAWVREIQAATATVVLTVAETDLAADQLTIAEMVWHGQPPPVGESLACQVQVRYRQPPVAATIVQEPDGRVTITLAQPVKAVTPGQAAVLYQEDLVLGLGWIDHASQKGCRR